MSSNGPSRGFLARESRRTEVFSARAVVLPEFRGDTPLLQEALSRQDRACVLILFRAAHVAQTKDKRSRNYNLYTHVRHDKTVQYECD